MPSLFRPVAAIASKALKRRRSAAEDFNKALNAAERVDPIPEGTDYTDKSFGHIYRLLGERTGDGLWECCRGHEVSDQVRLHIALSIDPSLSPPQQELIHWTGAYPFKHVRCTQCEHILCRNCCTTEVLSPLEHESPRPNAFYGATEHVMYGQICPGCGLSHRAHTVQTLDGAVADRIVTFAHLTCACGLPATTSWLQFRIGPADEYRSNPHEAFATLSCQRAEHSVRSRRESAVRDVRQSSLPLISPPWSTWPVLGSTQIAQTTWDLRIHEADWRYDFIGGRPYTPPAYFVRNGRAARLSTLE